MFNFKKKKEKLYKFVYKYSDFRGQQTLLIVAEDEIHAVKELYRLTNDQVGDIIEFTEVIPKKEK